MCDTVVTEGVVSAKQEKTSLLDVEMEEKANEVPSTHNQSEEPPGGNCQKFIDVVEERGAQDERPSLTAREEKGRKRKKPRRGKPKKQQWLRGKDPKGKEDEASQKRMRSNVFIHSQPAPNNTTQFIMADHTEFDVQLTALKGAVSKASRARDSSLSIDSDEEFYSSPEDEEEFLTKEFSNTYEDVHVERLGTMSKEELIQEYLQLEERVDFLEKKLKSGQSTSKGSADQCGNAGTDSDGEQDPGEMPMERAMAEKIRIFQEEINKLIVENEQLSKENERLRSSGSLIRPSSSLSSSSIDSESDSSTSSGSSSSSSSGQSSHSRLSAGSGTQRSHSPTNEYMPDNEEVETAATVTMTQNREVLSVVEVQSQSRNEVGKVPTDEILEAAFVEGPCASENAVFSSVLAS